MTTHGPLPLHAPVQARKVEPAAAVAVRVTDEAAAKLPAHSLPHAIPAGLDVIVPLPTPDFVANSARVPASAPTGNARLADAGAYVESPA